MTVSLKCNFMPLQPFPFRSSCYLTISSSLHLIWTVPDTSFSPPPSSHLRCSEMLHLSFKLHTVFLWEVFPAHLNQPIPWPQWMSPESPWEPQHKSKIQDSISVFNEHLLGGHSCFPQAPRAGGSRGHLRSSPKTIGMIHANRLTAVQPYGWTGARRRQMAPNPTLRGARHLWCPSVRLCHPLVGDAQSFAVPPESRHRLELPRQKVSGFSFQRWAKLSSLKHLLHLPFPFVQLAIVCWAAMKKY